MAQQLINLVDLVAGSAAWDATVKTNFDNLKANLRTLRMTVQTQGNSGTPSKIEIQLQDANGNNLAEQFYCRVRLAGNISGYPVGSGAGRSIAIADAIGAVVETVTASFDLILESTAGGLIRVLATYPAATFYICTGHPPVRPFFGNANQIFAVTHV